MFHEIQYNWVTSDWIPPFEAQVERVKEIKIVYSIIGFTHFDK